MAYIYIIHNDINDKKYIGKTEFSIKKRFLEHLADSSKNRNEKRPLYNAISKYGKEHFWVEEIEQCSHEEACEKEKFWIQFYNSYEAGYNATLGGDGRSYLDYQKILKLYDTTLKTRTEIAQECQCSVDSVNNIVEEYRDKPDWLLRQQIQKGKAIQCIETGQIFYTAGQAAEWLAETKGMARTSGASHISKVCNGKRQTCGGYHWKFI